MSVDILFFTLNVREEINQDLFFLHTQIKEEQNQIETVKIQIQTENSN